MFGVARNRKDFGRGVGSSKLPYHRFCFYLVLVFPIAFRHGRWTFVSFFFSFYTSFWKYLLIHEQRFQMSKRWGNWIRKAIRCGIPPLRRQCSMRLQCATFSAWTALRLIWLKKLPVLHLEVLRFFVPSNFWRIWRTNQLDNNRTVSCGILVSGRWLVVHLCHQWFSDSTVSSSIHEDMTR